MDETPMIIMLGPILAALAAMLASVPARAQQVTGKLGSPSATTTISGKQLPMATSSLFAKGGSREDRGAGPIPASANGLTPSSKVPVSREMVFAPGRRLTFRLTQNIDLQ